MFSKRPCKIRACFHLAAALTLKVVVWYILPFIVQSKCKQFASSWHLHNTSKLKISQPGIAPLNFQSLESFSLLSGKLGEPCWCMWGVPEHWLMHRVAQLQTQSSIPAKSQHRREMWKENHKHERQEGQMSKPGRGRPFMMCLWSPLRGFRELQGKSSLLSPNLNIILTAQSHPATSSINAAVLKRLAC